MEIRKIKGMKFRSGPFASTDIHNGGSIFGIIYSQILYFNENGQVTIHNEITLNRASFPEWSDGIENEKWEGTYSFDSDDKHVKCVLTNNKTKVSKQIYADFATDNILLAEVYDNESHHGNGQVFNIINGNASN